MIWRNIIFAGILLSTLSNDLVAQKSKIMRQPTIWENMLFSSESKNWGYFEAKLSTAKHDYWTFKYGRTNSNDWRVTCSNQDACAFSSPKNGNCQTKLKFRKTYWVTREVGDFVELTDDNLDLNVIGWVHKKDLILWNTPLRDNVTGIELKAFLINEGYDPNMNKLLDTKDTYYVYDSPTSVEPIEVRFIYDVLFVFKFDDSLNNNGRYLLSRFYNAGANRELLGWVDADKIKLWETSLCLEPNFSDEGLMERDSTGVNAVLFRQGQNQSLEKYYAEGIGKGITHNELRDPSNGNWEEFPRMNGQMMRYPIFGGSQGEDKSNCEFLTGVSGRNTLANNNVVEGLDDDYYQRLKSITKNLERLAKNVNVVFVVDGTENMLPYYKRLNEAIKQLNATYQSGNLFQYGAVVYRNTDFTNPDFEELCEVKPLSNDGLEVANWIKDRGEDLYDANLTVREEAVRYGINQALQLLPENETNIIFHIGNAPDLDEKGFLQAPGIKLSVSEMCKPLDKTQLDVHYIGFTSYSDQVTESTRKRCFEHMHNNYMKNISDFMNSKYKGKGTNYLQDLTQPTAPKKVLTSETGRVVADMEGSNFLIKSYWLKDDYFLDFFYDELFVNVRDCIEKQKETIKLLKELTEDNSKLSDQVEDFNPGVIQSVLYSTLNNLDSLERQDIISGLSKEKIHLFLDAITFYKTNSLQTPLFDYVLFMHEERLDAEIKSIERLSDAFEVSDDAVIRDLLSVHWKNKAQNVLGAGEYTALDIRELEERLMGIKGMDIVTPYGTSIYGNMSYKDIMKGKRLSPDQMKRLRDEVRADRKRLNKLKAGDYFYQIDGSEDRFYWVPVDYLFH